MKSHLIVPFFCLLLTCSSGYLVKSELTHVEPEEPFTIQEHTKINNLSIEEAIHVTAVKGFGDQKVYSGFVEVHPKTGASIYFIFYEALEANPDEAPVFLWLQGGPGSSSWLGNLTEFGPYNIQDNTLVRRDITWNNKYNLLFIDQPVGTGYSYVKAESDYVTDQDGVARDLYAVLSTFFKTYTKYADNDFYVFGESFAGHYVPAITHYIMVENERAVGDDFKINLKAMAIGDGLTDMEAQIATYSQYAFVNGLIDEKQFLKYKKMQDDAVNSIQNGDFKAGTDGFNNVVSGIQEDAGGVNIYNIRVYGPYPDMISDYLNDKKVKEMYNVPDYLKFKGGNDTVYNKLYNNISVSLKNSVRDILEQMPVLLYNGQNDFIVNTPGAENWIRSIEWTKQQDFMDAERKIHHNNLGQTAYYYREVGNLMQAVVLNAGHMVPMDQPENCMEMVDQFVKFAKDKQC